MNANNSFSLKNTITLAKGWMLNSSANVRHKGEEISDIYYDDHDWYPTDVPSTVLATLVKNGIYKDPFFGLNMKKINRDPFKVSWWYRKEFDFSADELRKTVLLAFDGINYAANIWLNGKQIASCDKVIGAFRRFQFDISEHMLSGKNVLAVQVIPPKPGDFSIGFVDWNPAPPDHNMGIFRSVTININRGVSIEHPFVQSKVNLSNLTEADLTISAELHNHMNQSISGNLMVKLESIEFSKEIMLNPNEVRLITLNSTEFKELHISQPRLWFPNQLGDPELYDLKLSFKSDNVLSDIHEITFGIREVQDYINQYGHRGYKINGKEVLIKGGGWTDDIFLADSPEKIEAQICYAKHMNLNCIRLEGIWGKDHHLYDLCDRNGILMMVGWSCHWEHQDYLGKSVDSRFGGVLTPQEIELISKSWQDQVIWLRNHPSIFVWTVGSDKVPKPELERNYIDIFKKHDPTRPYLASTGGVGSEQAIITDSIIVSDVSGSSRVKMLGPYDYTPPVYWYSDKKLGGAYGFNTETGPGAQVPPLSSIKKMIPRDHLWPVDEVWEYHCGLNVFGTLDRYQEALSKRYGAAKNVEDFAFKAQLLNYELMRPMFEAFQVNKGLATGIIQWMLNAAWPKLYWQLFDYYLLPNGAFYAARKACEAIHIMYNYGDEGIYIINDTFGELNNFTASIRLFDIKSHEIVNKTLQLTIKPSSSTLIMVLAQFEKLTKTYFLDLRLYNEQGIETSNNFYWLSTIKDVLDYETKPEEWVFYTPSKEYADFTELEGLPKIRIDAYHKFFEDGERQKVQVHVKNPGDYIAFFIELTIVKKRGDECVLPIFWDDNYISLLPGETRTIEGYYNLQDLAGDQVLLKVSGWNVTAKLKNT